MARNEIVIAAPRERVFAILADPAQYAEWVVGADSIHDADEDWPRPGSRLRHRTGLGPATIDDATEVTEARPPERLVLLAHLGILGSFRIDLTLEAVEDGSTRVVMEEEPVEGVSKLAGPAGDAAGRIRNALSLGRLKELAER